MATTTTILDAVREQVAASRALGDGGVTGALRDRAARAARSRAGSALDEDGRRQGARSGSSWASTAWARPPPWARWPRREAAAGRAVLLAAGDTFRAAAAEQLAIWAERAGVDIVRGAEGGDPSAVVFDAVQRAAARGQRRWSWPTRPGRLHNKVNLIEELKKIRRVADRPPGQVTEVLLVLDATTGQNGLAQAQEFLEAVDVTGVVLTKLDGTAKGGIVVAIQRELGLPVKLVGLGEGADDLIDFDPEAFVDALLRLTVGRGPTAAADSARRVSGSLSTPCSSACPTDSKASPAACASRGRLSDADVDEALREIRTALLEADVEIGVVRTFTDGVRGPLRGRWSCPRASARASRSSRPSTRSSSASSAARRSQITYASAPPTVVLLAGLQGSGKTTASAKLARWFKQQGRNPLLVGADLQRPAAVEQLRVLGGQAGRHRLQRADRPGGGGHAPASRRPGGSAATS